MALLALATGGFAIGTTEFVTMGLLPQIADGVGISIPTAGHIVSAASLNHSTLNVANALGAWLGSVVLAAGYGYEWPSRVGAGLALAGLLLAVGSGVMDVAGVRRGAAAGVRSAGPCGRAG